MINKIKCFFGLHTWKPGELSPNYKNRVCKHCKKSQWSFFYPTAWVTEGK